ncbi:peroxisomal membrane protein PEX14 isoform X3 [Trematomus bernacchii]|uniref:peroxisomal membrane protein PEX14 isoform X3 n=1 Tax=Trematomus bernacchii TaxID=40690 RepID=UPI00146B36E2|nr:peroxisomal membrane protein PEX14 isoform X3 [Trematomus bernacchii]
MRTAVLACLEFRTRNRGGVFFSEVERQRPELVLLHCHLLEKSHLTAFRKSNREWLTRAACKKTRKMASTEQPDPPTQPGLPLGDDTAAPPREALITTAVKFLQNPKVRQSPLATRKAFLTKKGLTDVEVELAIQRSGSTEEVLALIPVGPPHPHHATQLALAPHSPTGYRWRDYGALTIIMVGIAFGFHQLYKKYILPLIMGRREDKKHLQRMESNIAAMSGTLTQTVSQLQQTLVSVQELLIQQQQKIQELSQELTSSQTSSSTHRVLDNQTVGELKAEIVSLKGLLLSRKQFPSTPTIPKIPSWQIPLKPPSVPGSPPVSHTTSSSDISPVSNESANSSPIKDGPHSSQDAMGEPDVVHVINGDNGTAATMFLDLKDQVRMEVQGEEEEEEEEKEEEEEEQVEQVVSHVEEEEEEEKDGDGVSMHSVDRRGDGQMNEQLTRRVPE